MADVYEVLTNLAQRNAVRYRNESRKQHGGYSIAQVQAMWEAQGRVCAMCSKPTAHPYLDHNHSTGQVRGLICPGCNTGLGFVEKGIIFKALRYLRERDQTWLPQP